MIVTDRFVFLHMHKSGGTFINHFLMKFFPEAKLIGYHFPISELPSSHAHLPVIGTVRNPWEYYVSWHSFQKAMKNPNALFKIISNNGQLNFIDSIRNLTLLSEDTHRLQSLEHLLPTHFTGHGLNLTKKCLSTLANSGNGFYTFLYRRMYGALQDTHIIDMHQIRAQLCQALSQIGVGVDQNMIEYIKTSASLNVSKHDSYANYFDADLKNLIAEKDNFVIQKHHYTFAESQDKLTNP